MRGREPATGGEEHVEHLGQRGEIVKVADGYARNFLLPRKLALVVNEGNKRQIERERAKFEAKEAEDAANSAPVVKLLNYVILQAIKDKASDIHLEPFEHDFKIRYRVDGKLLEVPVPPNMRLLQASLISRLKIMANISIAEKRIPQDGRIQVNVGGKSLDLRVSSLPTVHGESIVMRILDKEGLQLGLPELGFFSDDQAVMEKLIGLPDGIFLVTGPTGSG